MRLIAEFALSLMTLCTKATRRCVGMEAFSIRESIIIMTSGQTFTDGPGCSM